MKQTTNRTTIDLVKRHNEINAIIKPLVEENASIKNELKAIMGEFETNVLAAGDFVMIVSNRTRTEINKEMVQELLGDKYKECLKKTEYQIFEIKKA